MSWQLRDEEQLEEESEDASDEVRTLDLFLYSSKYAEINSTLPSHGNNKLSSFGTTKRFFNKLTEQ